MPEALDVVRFDVDVGGWPAGTEATVLERYRASALVEIDDGEGNTLDMPVIPYSAMTVVWSGHHEHAV